MVQVPTTVLVSGLDLGLRDIMDMGRLIMDLDIMVLPVVLAVSVILDRLVSDIMVVLMGTTAITVITDR